MTFIIAYKKLPKGDKIQEAREYLLENKIITPETRLLIVIKSTSRSGMTRRMRVIVDNRDITYEIAQLCELSLNDNGLKIRGCGMDMTFWLAQDISHALWPDKETRPALTGNGGTCLEWTSI